MGEPRIDERSDVQMNGIRVVSVYSWRREELEKQTVINSIGRHHPDVIICYVHTSIYGGFIKFREVCRLAAVHHTEFQG